MLNKTAADEKVSDINFVYYENNKPGQFPRIVWRQTIQCIHIKRQDLCYLK